jgi:hypothetical protein
MSAARLLGQSALMSIALVLAACSGQGSMQRPSSAAPEQLPAVSLPEQPQQGDPTAVAAGEATVSAPLSATPGSIAIPLAGGYSASLRVHATNVPPGTKLVLGVRQPQASIAAGGSQRTASNGQPACPATFTIPLFNPFSFPIKLRLDGFSLHAPCNVDGTLFGVSFYQVRPILATVSPVKIGDVTAAGNAITFTSEVASITLPPHTASAFSVIPEDSTSEVGIPIVPGASTVLTANAPSLPSTLALNYANSGGGGSLFSSSCLPAYVAGVLAPALTGAVILGIPSFYCQLGTVNSPTVLFGSPTVTFTVGAPKPDRVFVGLDGPSSEHLCAGSGATTCVTPAFTVPTIQNVIVGNVADLQVCIPATKGTNCNSNANPAASPAPAAASVPNRHDVQLLVADDSTYVAHPGACSAPAICGGYSLDTSSGSCAINNYPDVNGDVPPGYKDPGGPQESPPVSSGTSTHALFPAIGPHVEFDLISGSSGTNCTVTVTETDGPLLRSTTYSVPVR